MVSSDKPPQLRLWELALAIAFVALFAASVAVTWGDGCFGVLVPFLVAILSFPAYLVGVLMIRRHREGEGR